MQMALLYNINRAEHVNSEPPASFMPYHDQFDEEISEEELTSRIRSILPKAIDKTWE